MNELELSREELINVDGGDLKDVALKTFWFVTKYSSVTGALLTGIVEGYYEDKSETN